MAARACFVLSSITVVLVFAHVIFNPGLCKRIDGSQTKPDTHCEHQTWMRNSPSLSVLSDVVKSTEANDSDGSVCISQLEHLLSQKNLSTLVKNDLCTSGLDAATTVKAAFAVCTNPSKTTTGSPGKPPTINDVKWLDNLIKSANHCCSGTGTSQNNNAIVSCFQEGTMLSDVRRFFSLVRNTENAAFRHCLREQGSLVDVEDRTKHLDIAVATLNATAPIEEILSSTANLNSLIIALSKNPHFKLSTLNGASFLLCNAISPLCKRRIPPCHTTCLPALHLLESVKAFVNISSEPVLSVIQAAATPCNAVDPSTRPCTFVTDEDGSNTTNLPRLSTANKSDDVIPDADSTLGFCFTPEECRPPLRATANKAHWYTKVQGGVIKIHGAASKLFRDTALPLNLSVLPCGRDCVTVGFTAYQQRYIRAILSTFSSLAVTAVTVAVFVFYFNRQKLARHALRRTLLFFNIAGGLACIPYCFSALYNNDSYICYPDKTLVTYQPGSHPTCGYLAWHAHFFVLVAFGYFAVLAYGWQSMIRNLNKPNATFKSMNTWWRKYREDIVGAACAVAPALVLTIATMAQRGYEGVPIYGVCAVSLQRGFTSNYYLWYILITLVPAGVFYSLGVCTLTRRHGVLGTLHWIRGKDEDSEGARLKDTFQWKSGNMKELKLLSRLLLIYLLLVAINTILKSAYGINLKLTIDNLVEQTSKHVECVTFRCAREKCPPLPTVSPTFFLAHYIGSMTSVVIVSSWAFSSKLLVNVPGVGALIRKAVLLLEQRSLTSSETGTGTGERPTLSTFQSSSYSKIQVPITNSSSHDSLNA